MDLEVSLGAGDVTLELGRANLTALAVSMGAADLHLDLRGAPARGYAVKVRAGAGDTRIELPSAVGLSVGTSGLIGDSNVSGLEKRGDRWINPRAGASAVTITLDVQHAVGDLRITAD